MFQQIANRRQALGITHEPEVTGLAMPAWLARRANDWRLYEPLSAEEQAAEHERAEQARKREALEIRSRRWDEFCASRGHRYRDCTLDGYQIEHELQEHAVRRLREYATEMQQRINGGQGVILVGPAGTGKDHLMAALARNAILRHGLTVRWWNGMEFFGEIRDRMDQEGRRESTFIRDQAYPDVLAFSDPMPPSGALTEFQSAMLFRVIDARYSQGKATWVTANAATRSELDSRMGVSIVDRLGHDALIVPCNWPSYRKPK